VLIFSTVKTGSIELLKRAVVFRVAAFNLVTNNIAGLEFNRLNFSIFMIIIIKGYTMIKKLMFTALISVMLTACDQGDSDSSLSDKAGDMVDATTDAANSAGDAIVDTSKEAVQAVGDAASDAKDAVSEKGDDMVDSAESDADAKIQEESDAAKSDLQDKLNNM
jgi:hypothetical protein